MLSNSVHCSVSEGPLQSRIDRMYVRVAHEMPVSGLVCIRRPARAGLAESELASFV